MHFRWNHFYQSADDFIYPKDIIRTETELAFLFMQYIKNIDFRILASVCVFPFLKKNNPSAKEWFSFHEPLHSVYSQLSKWALGESRNTEKDMEGVIPVNFAHVTQLR